jgi:2-polyprenyl-6-methoxyphenol hydroxylase-like FAD-dependent oxidoreductase
VIDRATFRSGTLSTHFFRGEGCVGVLRRLGVLEDVLALGCPPLVREYNADAIDGSYTVDPPQNPGEVGFNLSVRREPLDGILVERARREPTVDVREATMLRAIERNGDRVIGGVIADGFGTRLIRARLVIGVDGHASRVAKLVDAPLQDEIPPSRAMYYRYIQGLEGPDGDPDGRVLARRRRARLRLPERRRARVRRLVAEPGRLPRSAHRLRACLPGSRRRPSLRRRSCREGCVVRPSLGVRS